MKKVLILGPVHDAGVGLLRSRADVALEIVSLDESRLEQAVRDAHGIIVRTTIVDRALIDAAEVLEIVSRHGVGTDSVDIQALTERGIPLTITPGSNSPSVAEHTLFMLLALAKQCRPNDTETRNGEFLAARAAMRPIDVQNRNMLIIGFGRIGSLVAPLARAFGMQVFAYDPYIDQTIITDAGCTPLADFRTVLGKTDVLTLHCPLTPETRGIIGQAELGALKPGGFVINTARGGIVDESALAQALQSGALAGAGLDVFECEPATPQPDHPLFRFDNVITSPHCAGVSVEASVRTAEQAARNVLDCFDGKLDPGAVVNGEMLKRR
ncbi:MAG: hydroxyacid dehydrogenase [Gammaproteobacteria bacterium]|nr:hydroxyacid dehydrogenase [Gammaproteobacteria bacterium]